MFTAKELRLIRDTILATWSAGAVKNPQTGTDLINLQNKVAELLKELDTANQ